MMRTDDKQAKVVLRLSRVRIVVLIISLLVYFGWSNWRWRNIVSQNNAQLQRMVSVLNNELEYVVQNSYNILSNPYVIQMLSADRSFNLTDNLELLNMLDLFFLYYANGTTADRPTVIIYHDNENIFENRYLQYLDRMDSEVYAQLQQLEYGEGLWSTRNGQLYYYCSFYQRLGDMYIEYKVDSSLLKRHIHNSERLQNNEHILWKLDYEGDGKKYRLLEERLISGTKITVAIPYSYLSQIYIHNLLFLGFIVIVILVLLRWRTMKTYHTVASNINYFADEIMSIDPLEEINYLPCDTGDEMYPIYSKINELLNTIHTFREEKERHERKELELEINLLQSKLNPHLLFNSLSVLRWKLYEISPEVAENISVLTRYFRDALSGDSYAVTLKEEVELAKEYVAVMEVLNNRKYNLEVEMEESLQEEMTMKLILQPFVENAILHGLQSVENPAIRIVAVRTTEGYQIRVEDDGCGITKQKVDIINGKLEMKLGEHLKNERQSYGIRNSFERIDLFYSQKCASKIESQQGKGTKVILNVKQ